MFLLRAAVILIFFTSNLAYGRIYQRCELARELRNFDVPENEISTWVCIAKYESLFNTAAMNHGSGDHGLFQISQLYWCSPPGQGYGCNSPCSKFRDDDISDDLQCIRRIHSEHKRISGNGFNAWVVYHLYCKEDTSGYISDCFDGQFTVGLLPSSNVTENEISSSEESGEYGDGYKFPSLPNFSKMGNLGDDGYAFPDLPKIEMNSSRNIKKLLPFNKVSIHNFVSVNRKLPYSEVSISYFTPVNPENNKRNPSDKIPFSIKSIHHFMPVKQIPTTDKAVLFTSVALSKTSIKNDDLQMSSLRSVPATFKPLPTFKTLQPFTLNKSTTKAHSNFKQLNALTKILPDYQQLEKISSTKILPTNNVLQKSTFTSVPSKLKPMPTLKPLKFLSIDTSTIKTTQIVQRPGLELTTTRALRTILNTIKSLPNFRSVQYFTSQRTSKKSPFSFQTSDFEHVTKKSQQLIATTTSKTTQDIFNKTVRDSYIYFNELTTLKPSARQVTFAPDSWFSWIFNSQTLPPILPPPQRPPSGNPDRPRPGGLPPSSLNRPSAPPRPIRPSAPGTFHRPLGPNGRPEMGGLTTKMPFLVRPSDQGPLQRPLGLNGQPDKDGSFTTRRPFLMRPTGNQPSRIQSVFQQTVIRPVGPYRPARPMLRRAENVDPLVKIYNDESSITKKYKGLNGAEIMLDNHSVLVRTRYGFSLFRIN